MASTRLIVCIQAAPQVPILVMSYSRDEAVAKLAVKRGAQDYLLKGHLDSYLLTKVGAQHDRARRDFRSAA